MAVVEIAVNQFDEAICMNWEFYFGGQFYMKEKPTHLARSTSLIPQRGVRGETWYSLVKHVPF